MSVTIGQTLPETIFCKRYVMNYDVMSLSEVSQYSLVPELLAYCTRAAMPFTTKEMGSGEHKVPLNCGRM